MIWVLLIIFQFKHFIADYLLQGKYMLGKFKEKDWIGPLASHCAIHLVFTSLIAAAFGIQSDLAICLGGIDFTIHFIMDRIKASPKMLGKYNALSKNEMLELIKLEKLCQLGAPISDKEIVDKKRSNVLFWWSLGLDQMVHHLTDILIIYLIIKGN